MSVFQGIQKHYHLLGLQGVAGLFCRAAFGFPKTMRVNAPHPITLRLRSSDLSVFRDILQAGAYELDMLPGFSPRTIVDAGANIGMAALFFAQRYPEAQIVAVEPESANFELLVKNSRPYRKIVPVKAALWHVDGEVCIAPNPEDYLPWAFRIAKEGTRVRSVSIPTLMRETGLQTIDLLKVDVEGAEREIFTHARPWIHLVRAMVIETHDRFFPGCTRAVLKAAHCFQKWERGEMTFFSR